MGRSKEEMAIMQRQRQEKLTPEQRQDIARRAVKARWMRFATATDVAKVNYVERKLLRILDNELTDQETLLKTAMTMLAWERHRMNLIMNGLAEKPVDYQVLPTPRNAPPPPEVDLSTLTNDQLREMAKGIVRPSTSGPGPGNFRAQEAAELNRKVAEMPVTTRDPEGNDPDR